MAERKKSKGFTAEEKAAMKARAQELKAEERASENRAEGERALLSAITAIALLPAMILTTQAGNHRWQVGR